MNKIRFLKVKIKSLAAEARIIRQEERKSRVPLRDALHSHRVVVLRREARASQLAYGFLRGRAYNQLEPTRNTQPDERAVARMVKKYGGVEMDPNWYAGEKPGIRSAA